MPALITSEFHFTTEDIGAVIDLDPYQAGNTAIDEGLVVNSDTGGIEIEGGGSIRGGLSDFDDTTDEGFFFGFDQDTLAHVATIGDPSNENLTWNGDDLKLDIDGSNLTVNGGTTGQGLAVASDGTVTFVDLVNVLNDLSDVNASPSVGQFLKWSGTQWTHSNITNILGIGDMTDVVISTVATDNILKYNGTNWVNVAPSALGASLVLNDLSNVNASPSVGQFLKWSGTEWSHSNITNILGIGDMTDVVISTVATDNILKYNGTNWVNVAPSTLASSISGSIALDDLSNVNANTSLADDEVLVYNTASGGSWSNQSVVTIADNIKLRHLDDVSYVDGSPTLTNNKYLKYNGTTWVAADVSLALNDLSNVTAASPNTGQFLKWNGTAWVNSNVTGVLELNDLSGVTITSVATDNILKYNGTNWVNTAFSLNDLSGVNLGTLPPTTPVVTGTAVPVLAYEASSSQWKATVLELDDLYGVPVPTVEGSILYVSDETHAEEFLWSTNFKMVGGTSATAFPEATDTFTATSDLFAGPSIVLNNENSGMTAASNYHYGSIKFNGNDSGTGANGIRGSIVGDSVGLNGALDLVFSTAADSATVQEAMRIDSSGNVGIGTSDPSETLHVNAGNNNDVATFESTDSNAKVNFKDSTSTSAINTNNGNMVLNCDLNDEVADSFMAFRVDNDEKMRIEDTGRVGIGTDSPEELLHLTDTGGNAVLKFTRNDTTTTSGSSVGTIQFAHKDADDAGVAASIAGKATNAFGKVALTFATGNPTTKTERMRLDADGNLGIGTSSPASLLHIETGANGNIIQANGASNAWDFILKGTNDQDTSSVLYEMGMYRDDGVANPNTVLKFGRGLGTQNGFFAIDQNGTEAMRITPSGDVLVAKTSDDISTNGLIVNSNGYTKITRTSGTANVNAVLMLNRRSTDGDVLDFRKDDTTVGSIGVLSSRLYIGSGDTGIKFSGADDLISPIDASDGTGRDAAIDLGSSSTRFKDLYLSGNVTHGTTPSSSAAGVFTEAAGRTTYSRGSGTGGFSHLKFTNGNGTVGTVTTSNSATAYNTSSDQRLKDNIVDAPSASEDIDAIQVRSFDWKADGSHQKYGMVAQELSTVAPEAVSEGETEEDMMGVDYSKLVPMMLKEIQSLRARVAQLEGEN